jgi:2-methylcitrate dehydratase PrpD
MTTIAHRIAGFTSQLTYAELPEPVREKARVTLLHNLGVALAAGAGARVPCAYAENTPRGSARLLISGRPASAEAAAFVNAAILHARAQDDVYYPGLTHVGASIIPALLALGEEHDATGADLVTALVAGYETAAAVSEGVAPRTTARGFRATGLYGVIGAAAGAARLLGLDQDETANALGIATSLASGTNQTWIDGSEEYQFQVGAVARNGVTAALLAAAGGIGSPHAFEGAQGFYNAFVGDSRGFDDVATDLGVLWRILDVTYKPFPVCALLQAPVSEAVELRRGHDLDAHAIDRVRIDMAPADAHYPGTDATGPFRSAGATLMSAQFCLAVALRSGAVRAEDLQRVDDTAVLDLARRIVVYADPDLAPQAFRLEVTLRDGRTLRGGRAGTESFNWDRTGVVAQLKSMAAEFPDAALPDRLEAAALRADQISVRELVSACVIG